MLVSGSYRNRRKHVERASTVRSQRLSAASVMHGAAEGLKAINRAAKNRIAHGAFAPTMEPMRGCRIPKITHIRACGVHVCRMEKCTLRGLRPVRNPTQNVPKAAFPLELTLRTFVVYTQTKPGKLWDATRGPQGAQECLICTHRTPSVRRSEGIPP